MSQLFQQPIKTRKLVRNCNRRKDPPRSFQNVQATPLTASVKKWSDKKSASTLPGHIYKVRTARWREIGVGVRGIFDYMESEWRGGGEHYLVIKHTVHETKTIKRFSFESNNIPVHCKLQIPPDTEIRQSIARSCPLTLIVCLVSPNAWG